MTYITERRGKEEEGTWPIGLRLIFSGQAGGEEREANKGEKELVEKEYRAHTKNKGEEFVVKKKFVQTKVPQNSRRYRKKEKRKGLSEEPWPSRRQEKGGAKSSAREKPVRWAGKRGTRRRRKGEKIEDLLGNISSE